MIKYIFLAQTVDIFNPLAWLGVKTPGELVVVAFAGFASILAFVAIAWTVFSGVKMILATNEESIESAKKSLTWSVGGFIVGLLSFTLIAGAAKLLGFDPNQVGLGKDTLETPIFTGNLPESRNFIPVMYFVMKNFLGIVGFASILMIIYYGYKYITSAGNEEAVEKAKVGLKWTIAGFIVTVLAFTIINVVRGILLSPPPS